MTQLWLLLHRACLIHIAHLSLVCLVPINLLLNELEYLLHIIQVISLLLHILLHRLHSFSVLVIEELERIHNVQILEGSYRVLDQPEVEQFYVLQRSFIYLVWQSLQHDDQIDMLILWVLSCDSEPVQEEFNYLDMRHRYFKVRHVDLIIIIVLCFLF
jgi:hypothetical protein